MYFIIVMFKNLTKAFHEISLNPVVFIVNLLLSYKCEINVLIEIVILNSSRRINRNKSTNIIL